MRQALLINEPFISPDNGESPDGSCRCAHMPQKLDRDDTIGC